MVRVIIVKADELEAIISAEKATGSRILALSPATIVQRRTVKGLFTKELGVTSYVLCIQTAN